MKRLVTAAAASLLLGGAALAQSADMPGVTKDNIRIGQTTAFSGGASAYSVIVKAHHAYLDELNAKGGINGRKVELISLDDGYAPPKTVEQTRKLVEQDGVSFIFNPLGTATGLAVQKYLNNKGVPQLFVASGNSGWDNPKQFPWTTGFQPSYFSEGVVIGRYIAKNLPNGKVALLHQADDFGKDYLHGLRKGLGANADKQLVKVVSYQPTDPVIDSQLVELKASGADVFVNVSVPKYTAQAIRKVAQMGWKPTHFVSSISASVAAVMKPAGVENGVGVIATAYLKDPLDPQWKDDPGMKEFHAFMDRAMPSADRADTNYVYGYTSARVLEDVLKRAGNDLSRKNIMKTATTMNLDVPTLLPGIKIQNTPERFSPITRMQLTKFDGKTFHPFGEIISAE